MSAQEDGGDVLGQVNVPIYPEDTVESLEARLNQAGPQLLVSLLQDLTRD